MTEPKTIKPESPVKSNKTPIKKPPEKPYRKADYKAFVKFYTMPSVFRQEEYGFRTEKDFAKEFELSPDTLVDWKKRKEFEKDVDIQLAKWGADKTPDVIAALYRTILTDGKAAEVKLWLQYIKRWKEGMILEQPSLERDNKLNKLLENADEKTKQQFAELLKTILPDNRANKEQGDKQSG